MWIEPRFLCMACSWTPSLVFTFLMKENLCSVGSTFMLCDTSNLFTGTTEGDRDATGRSFFNLVVTPNTYWTLPMYQAVWQFKTKRQRNGIMSTEKWMCLVITTQILMASKHKKTRKDLQEWFWDEAQVSIVFFNILPTSTASCTFDSSNHTKSSHGLSFTCRDKIKQANSETPLLFNRT